MKPVSLLLIFALFGAGCTPRFGSSTAAGVPSLRIQAPRNGVVVDSNTIEVVGTTNAPEVWIGQERHRVVNRSFAVPVVLTLGQNVIPLVVGNGYSTTTLDLTVERAIPKPL